MSCRTTAAGSALTTYARLTSGLSDVQTLSAFHALRVEGRGHERPTAEEWERHIQTARALVQINTDFTDARRASLLSRLDRAAGEQVDGATWYALRNLTVRTLIQRESVTRRLAESAEHLGLSLEEVQGRYYGYQDQIDRARSAEAPAGYSDEAVQAARRDRLPEDRGSVVAMQRIEAEVLRARADRALSGPQRIERQRLDSGALAEAGYDPDGGRLEVVFRGADGTNSRVYAYRGVPAQAWEQIRSGSAGTAFNAHVRNHPEYRYASQEEADLESAARQCADCGQFAASSHACPVRAQRAAAAQQASAQAGAGTGAAAAARPEPRRRRAPGRSWRRVGQIAAFQGQDVGNARYDQILTPSNLAEMRVEAGEGPIFFNAAYTGERFANSSDVVNGVLPQGYFQVQGRVVYDRPARGRHEVTVHDPQCLCATYQRNGDCPHIEPAVRRITAALLPVSAAGGPSRAADPEAAQAAVEQALRQDWMRAEATAAEARERWASAADSPDNYSAHPEAFEADRDAALARQAAGEHAIEYATGNAAGDLFTRESGRGVGVELEFDFPSEMDWHQREAALAAIGRDLHTAGLTSGPFQTAYGSSRRAGYTDNHAGGWSFERDGTVSGEIVSPVMYDEPQTWENLTKVCEIVGRHGGVASRRTGSHVHVGTKETTAGTAAELVRMANQHEDVMYRISQNPQRGTHRPMSWCGPNRDIAPSGYTSVDAVRHSNNSHNFGVNLQSVHGRSSDHAEIRHWDGTLDPAVIQTQIKISAAMMAAAERNGTITAEALREREPVGAHVRRAGGRRTRRALTGEALAEDSATARSFADTLFTRREDKAQFAALFAITKWQRRGH